MKSSSKKSPIILGLLLVLALVIVGTQWKKMSGVDFQGRFITANGVIFDLSPQSPWGPRNLSTTDDIFDFTIEASPQSDFIPPPGSKMSFTFSSITGDLDFNSSTWIRLVDDSGNTMGSTTVTPLNALSTRADIPLIAGFKVAKGHKEEFHLIVDTSSLIKEDVGQDDSVAVRLGYVRKSVIGNTLIY